MQHFVMGLGLQLDVVAELAGEHNGEGADDREGAEGEGESAEEEVMFINNWNVDEEVLLARGSDGERGVPCASEVLLQAAPLAVAARERQAGLEGELVVQVGFEGEGVGRLVLVRVYGAYEVTRC